MMVWDVEKSCIEMYFTHFILFWELGYLLIIVFSTLALLIGKMKYQKEREKEKKETKRRKSRYKRKRCKINLTCAKYRKKWVGCILFHILSLLRVLELKWCKYGVRLEGLKWCVYVDKCMLEFWGEWSTSPDFRTTWPKISTPFVPQP